VTPLRSLTCSKSEDGAAVSPSFGALYSTASGAPATSTALKRTSRLLRHVPSALSTWFIAPVSSLEGFDVRLSLQPSGYFAEDDRARAPRSAS